MELFVMLIFLTATGAQVGLSQLEGPQNTLSIVGSNVTLKCSSPSRNCNGIDWQKYVFGASPMTIFKGPRTFILNVNGIDRDRYSVDNSSGCDLVIKNVQLKDAGRFICSAIILSTQTTKTAQLIVLETEPNCTRNSTENTTEEGDRVQLNCEALYSGASKATIAWKAGNDSPDAVNKGTPSNCRVKTKEGFQAASTGELTTVTYNETNKALMLSTGYTDSPSAVLNGKIICQSYIVVASAPEVPSFTCIVTFSVETADNYGVPIAGLATNIPIATCKTPTVKVLYTTTNNSLGYIMMAVAVGILLLIILLIICFCNETCPGYKFYNSGNKPKDGLRDEQPPTENSDVGLIYSVVNKGQDIHSEVKSPNRPKGPPPPQPKAGNTDAFQHEEVTYADLAMEYGPRKVVPQNVQAAQEESVYAAVSVA